MIHCVNLVAREKSFQVVSQELQILLLADLVPLQLLLPPLLHLLLSFLHQVVLHLSHFVVQTLSLQFPVLSLPVVR